MNKYLNRIMFVFIAILALAATGCARARTETPVTAPTTRVATAIPASIDGTPTVLVVGATATSVPIFGTPTPVQINPTATTGSAASGGGTTEIAATPTLPAPPTAVTAPAPPPSNSGGSGIVHIVKPGENLFRIGLQYGVDAGTLAAYNGISDPTVIYVGQKIRIPGGGTSYGSGQTYIVQPGDTLYTIAVSFNVTIQALMNANNITNPDTIYAGRQLTVP